MALLRVGAGHHRWPDRRLARLPRLAFLELEGVRGPGHGVGHLRPLRLPRHRLAALVPRLRCGRRRHRARLSRVLLARVRDDRCCPTAAAISGRCPVQRGTRSADADDALRHRGPRNPRAGCFRGTRPHSLPTCFCAPRRRAARPSRTTSPSSSLCNSPAFSPGWKSHAMCAGFAMTSAPSPPCT